MRGVPGTIGQYTITTSRHKPECMCDHCLIDASRILSKAAGKTSLSLFRECSCGYTYLLAYHKCTQCGCRP